MTGSEIVLKLGEAAQRAGLSRRSLERVISVGLGPSLVRLSARRVGVLESDLALWLRSRRIPAPGTVSAPDEGADAVRDKAA